MLLALLLDLDDSGRFDARRDGFGCKAGDYSPEEKSPLMRLKSGVPSRWQKRPGIALFRPAGEEKIT